MSTKTLDHLRVVVHLNDAQDDERNSNRNILIAYRNRRCGQNRVISGLEKPTKSPDQSIDSQDYINCEMLMKDKSNLTLTQVSTDDAGSIISISTNHTFDHVSQHKLDMLREELTLVMEDLLLKRTDSCIARYSTLLKCEVNAAVFFDLLMIIIDQHLHDQKLKLQIVTLKCTDTRSCCSKRKKPSSANSCSTIAANRAGLDESSNFDYATKKLNSKKCDEKHHFRNTRDLLSWLLNVHYNYIQMADLKDHEILIFDLALVDSLKNMFRVQLNVFNVYVDLMDMNERRKWYTYIDRLGEGRQNQDSSFRHSYLTKCLSEHIHNLDNKCLLIFNIPSEPVYNIELLRMADSVVKNRLKIRQMSPITTPTSSTGGRNINEVTFCTERRSSLPLETKPTQTAICSVSKAVCKPKRCTSQMDLNARTNMTKYATMSSWYDKIDDHITAICSSLQSFYGLYFNLKITKLTDHMHHMIECLDNPMQQAAPQLLGGSTQKDTKQLELRDLADNCRTAKSKFHNLALDIQHDAQYEDNLRFYLRKKRFELDRYYKELKMKQRSFCQQSFVATLNAEKRNLNTQLDI